MARRRKAKREEFLDMLLEFTGLFWQLGVVVSVLFFVLAAITFRWVSNHIALAEASPLLGPMMASYGWMLYGLPLILLVLAWLFGVKAYAAYAQQGRF